MHVWVFLSTERMSQKLAQFVLLPIFLTVLARITDCQFLPELWNLPAVNSCNPGLTSGVKKMRGTGGERERGRKFSDS